MTEAITAAGGRSGAEEILARILENAGQAGDRLLAAADEKTEKILADAAEHPRLFSRPEDGSIAAWVERLGCYSPIIHLQQSDGVSSPHWPFSPEYNRRGVVSGEAFMESLGRAFAREDAPGMPPQVDEVALTLEPFLGTMANVYDAVEEIAQSVAYWRRFVPRDGMRLSEALALMRA